MAIRSRVAASTTSRPFSVMEASVPRPSWGLGRLSTRPDLTSRSTNLDQNAQGYADTLRGEEEFQKVNFSNAQS